MLQKMHSFSLEKQVKIVIPSMTLHNFIRINDVIYMELRSYYDDQRLFPPNEEGSRVEQLVEEDYSYYVRRRT